VFKYILLYFIVFVNIYFSVMLYQKLTSLDVQNCS